jgi:hypothetical protein
MALEIQGERPTKGETILFFKSMDHILKVLRVETIKPAGRPRVEGEHALQHHIRLKNPRINHGGFARDRGGNILRVKRQELFPDTRIRRVSDTQGRESLKRAA